MNEQDDVVIMERMQNPVKAFVNENFIYSDIVEETQKNGTKIKNLVRFLYSRKFDGQTMTGVIAVDRTQNRVNRITVAKSAKLGKSKKIWDFYDGAVYEIDPKDRKTKIIKQFKYLQVNLGKTQFTFNDSYRSRENLTLKQDNVTYSQFFEEIQPDGLRVKNLAQFFYARKIDGQEMTDIMIIYLAEREAVYVTDVRFGKWDISNKSWILSNVTTYAIDLKSKILTENKSDRYQIRYPQLEELNLR